MATQRSYPFVGNGATSDAEWSMLMRESIGTGVRTGLEVYANSTGLKVFVRPGDAKVRGHEYINEADGDIELAIVAPGATARTDAIILRLEYGAVKSITVKVKQGTPGAPTMTQTDSAVYEMVLAYVTVPASAVTITAGNVSDRRSYLALGTPAGVLLPYAGAVVPGGWLLADGRVLNRVDYPTLFAAVGVAYNTGGELSTQFRLPNPLGRTIVGVDAAQAEFNTLGEKGGAKTHTLTTAEMPSHSHGQAVVAARSTGQSMNRTYSSFGISQQLYSSANDAETTVTGGGGAHNNLQPYLALNFIIKI